MMLTQAGLTNTRKPIGYSSDELIQALHDANAAINGEHLTQTIYTQWRDSEPLSRPSTATISTHFGGWKNACAAAGLEPGPGHTVKFDKHQITTVLAKVDRGYYITHAFYQHWRKTQTSAYPSAATIVNRFGTWSAACDAAGLKQFAI